MTPILSHIYLLSSLAALTAAWNPSNEYAPSFVECPSSDFNLYRPANRGLLEQERDWVEERHKQTDPALKDFIKRVKMENFDVDSFMGSNTSINLGLAFSGGGYRAMICGAGQFAALDNRTEGSTEDGHLGGLVQSATYLAGLSGGSWLVGSIMFNNFTSIGDLMTNGDIWDLKHSIINPGGINIFSTAKYYDDLTDEVEEKKDKGFNISITDIWGRALSQQFIDLPNGGPGMAMSDIQNFPPFVNHESPFPFFVACGRAPNTKIISLNSTVFEFGPYELGSWDPHVYGFANMTYIGTDVENGKPKNDSACVVGFDQAGFAMGTSSSLFNQFILQINETGVNGVLYKLAMSILTDLDEDENDIAAYNPNPFYKTNEHTIAQDPDLDLVDGGEDLQNVPFYPLIQPERKVDVIMAYDNSADTDYNWPNGASIQATYARQFGAQGNGTYFPYVPDNNTFVNLGFNKRPVFFGCYASNFTSLRQEVNATDLDWVPPVIVYTSNSYYTYNSNKTTFTLSYERDEMVKMIENTYATATRGNGTIDSEFPACVACAIVQREFERRGLPQTEQCKRCFDNYCWNGTLNNTVPTVIDSNSLQAAQSNSESGKSGDDGKKNSASIAQVDTFKVLSMAILIAITFVL